MRNVVRCCISLCLIALCCGCEEQSTKRGRENAPGAAPVAPPAGGEPSVSQPSEPGIVEPWQFGSDSLAAVTATTGAGGEPSDPKPIVAPFGTSTACGDAIVGDDEECDDGDDGSDACTDECQTRDSAVVPWADSASADRYQGAGRHPLAGLDAGFISTYVSVGDAEPAVGATVFDIWGKRSHVIEVSAGGLPIDEANPVAAALPGGRYAVAWNDFDGDGSDLGVALREVRADGALGPLLTANGGREFSQLNPDMIWIGTELVVAWEDYSDPYNGPDLRLRTFDAELNPKGNDVVLAASEAPEAAVSLTPFTGGWAAAFREGGSDGKEFVVVRAAARTIRIGPFVGGPLDDRPALVALDENHLLVAFSVQTDPSASGGYDISRVRYAVVDVEGPATQSSSSLDPLDDVYTLDDRVSQSSPSLAAGSDGYYLAWRTEARTGDAAGDQLWLKYLSWDSVSSALRLWEQEMLIPRTCEASAADQRRPALARVGLPPWGALAIARDEYAFATGGGSPDVAVHYAPTHERAADRVQTFTEKFWGAAATSWGTHWSIEGAPTLAKDILRNEARVLSSGAGAAVHYVNRHTALDVDLRAKVRMNNNGESVALVARRTDASGTYLGMRFGTAVSGEPVRVYTMTGGTRTDVATLAAPYLFAMWAQQVDFWVRFRVQTDLATGEINLAGKVWQAWLPEPSAWLVSGNVPPTMQPTFANRSGHFGFQTSHSQANRTIYIDEVRAEFVEGSVPGGGSAIAELGLPLRRSAATYRICQPNQPCQRGEGCCLDDTECLPGLTCSREFGEHERLGSHASVCAPAHCSDKRLTPSTDEARADCGGADCPSCSCAPAAARGTGGYCSDTCKCGIGDADCNTSSNCLAGLVCAQERGYKYGWADGIDVCMPSHCLDRVQSADETGVDTGGSCGNVACGSSTNGGYQHCTPSCPCPKGEGNVNYNDECQGGLVVGVGARWGYTFDVCVAPHCANNKKDADETGVDCGGVDCGPVCP